MNEKIRVSEVRLIDKDGEQLGVVPMDQALERARTQELDLVEVAPEARPPVCKIMDYRRQIFEQKRKQKEARKKAKSLEMKEMKLRPNIDDHDYETKMGHVRKFLEKGHKVKITMRYRPREMRQFQVGTDVLNRIVDDMTDIAEVDRSARHKGGARMQAMVLAPTKKSKKPKAESGGEQNA